MKNSSWNFEILHSRVRLKAEKNGNREKQCLEQCIPFQQYITNDHCMVYHSCLAHCCGRWFEPDRAVCQCCISAARAAVVLFCMISCRRTSAALPGFRVHVPAELPNTETHSGRHFGGKKQAPPPPLNLTFSTTEPLWIKQEFITKGYHLIYCKFLLCLITSRRKCIFSVFYCANM